MYKIFLTVRNRLAITTKCISAIKKHSTLKHEIFVFDNLTNYKTDEHFMYWNLLYQRGLISQVTFNTKESTFNAFSKVVSCNQFGHIHQMDPDKKRTDFLVFLDNDIIVTKEWDSFLFKAWKEVEKLKLNHIKIISQLPGGIMHKHDLPQKICGYNTKTGKAGGSGLWCVKSNFFEDIGFLNINHVIGVDKKHDQKYWTLLETSTKGKDFILGTDRKVGIHCGKLAGSTCNILTRNKNDKNKLDLIRFEKEENEIDKMSFDEFYQKIKNDQTLTSGF